MIVTILHQQNTSQISEIDNPQGLEVKTQQRQGEKWIEVIFL